MSDKNDDIKVVVVIRKDLKVRRGKEIIQGGHAYGSWMAEKLRSGRVGLTDEQEHWLSNRVGICLQVASEAELFEVLQKAKENKLSAHLVTDRGTTEFDGVPTNTAICIGPHRASKIDPVTGHLKLY